MKKYVFILVSVLFFSFSLRAQETKENEDLDELPQAVLARNMFRIAIPSLFYRVLDVSYEYQIAPLKSIVLDFGYIGKHENMCNDVDKGMLFKFAYRKYANSYQPLASLANRRIFNGFYMSPQFIYSQYVTDDIHWYLDEYGEEYTFHEDKKNVYKTAILLNMGCELPLDKLVFDFSAGVGVGGIFGANHYEDILLIDRYSFINLLALPVQPVFNFNFSIGFRY